MVFYSAAFFRLDNILLCTEWLYYLFMANMRLIVIFFPKITEKHLWNVWVTGFQTEIF